METAAAIGSRVQRQILDQNSIPIISSRGLEKPKDPECPTCSDTGWELVPGGGVKPCECRRRKIAAERVMVIMQDWPEYRNADLATYRPTHNSVGQENAFRQIKENPRGNYFITGYFSRGKTHLMIAQYRYLALAGERCLLRSSRELFKELQKAEAPPDPGQKPFESEVLRMASSAPSGHLFIDDIEKAPARSGFRLEALWDLLDCIKRRQLGLTITSNLPLIAKDEKDGKEVKGLASAIGEEAVSRIYRICKVIEL